MRLMRFSYTISHVPGKSLTTADTLSRAPINSLTEEDEILFRDADLYVNMVVSNIPATDKRLIEIQEAQEKDEIYKMAKQQCREGWSTCVKGPLKHYAAVASELSIHNNLLFRNSRLVIPESLRKDIIERLHSGHQGITKCLRQARTTVWWPGITRQLKDYVEDCPTCAKNRYQPAEPLITSTLPEYPWQRVAADLFEWQNTPYLLVVDYYSRFIEIAKLTSTSSLAVIHHFKSIFARYGIPVELTTDNGPQFSANVFSEFSNTYGFTHKTSSPHFPQSNGEAKRAVQTTKQILAKNKDPYLGLLAYRSTPLENGYSPSELLMGRKLRTMIPTTPSQLKPKLPHVHTLKKREKEIKDRQKRNFDKTHKARSLSPLREGDKVWLPNGTSGTVSEQLTSPRSYNIVTSSGTVRRNRRHLTQQPISNEVQNDEQTPTSENISEQTIPETESNHPQLRTRSGRLSQPPKRLIEETD